MISTRQYGMIRDATTTLSNLDENIIIDDTGSPTVGYIGNNLRKHRPDVALIDYLQIIRGRRSGSTTRNDNVAEISSDLKGYAKNFNLPIVVLSQVNRESARSDRPPSISDLRDSGAIEQDADVIIFVHRQEMTKPTPENEGRAQIIVGKNRNGPIGKFEVGFDKGSMRFIDDQY